ncbi:MAG: hypothetical protein ABIT76_11415 [Chthoniobacterales bacterium]
MTTPAFSLPSREGERLYDWLFIDLNSYFASVEQQVDPELRGRPVIVIPTETDFTCAIAASYEAKAFGIKTGTPVLEAKTRCPQVAIRLANSETYVIYHNKILEEIDRHILVDNVASIDEMACRLTGKWRIAENAIELARRIKAGIAERVGVCMTSSIGISTNRFLAKVGSDMQKPDGLVVLHPAEFPGRLSGLVPRDLPGIGANMEHRLHAAGIRTIEQLWVCPARQLRGIWRGVQGERFWYALRGVEIPPEEVVHRSLGHSHVLAPVDRPFAMAELVGRRLTLKCASRLRRDGFLAQGMSLSVWVVGALHMDYDVRFPPVADSLSLQKMFVHLWSQLRAHSDATPLKKVSITLHDLVPADAARQLEFFTAEKISLGVEVLSHGPAAQEKRDRLTGAMDRLNTRFGSHTVTLGIMPGAARNFTGNKIAFNRVPLEADFI